VSEAKPGFFKWLRETLFGSAETAGESANDSDEKPAGNRRNNRSHASSADNSTTRKRRPRNNRRNNSRPGSQATASESTPAQTRSAPNRQSVKAEDTEPPEIPAAGTSRPSAALTPVERTANHQEQTRRTEEPAKAASEPPPTRFEAPDEESDGNSAGRNSRRGRRGGRRRRRTENNDTLETIDRENTEDTAAPVDQSDAGFNESRRPAERRPRPERQPSSPVKPHPTPDLEPEPESAARITQSYAPEAEVEPAIPTRPAERSETVVTVAPGKRRIIRSGRPRRTAASAAADEENTSDNTAINADAHAYDAAYASQLDSDDAPAGRAVSEPPVIADEITAVQDNSASEMPAQTVQPWEAEPSPVEEPVEQPEEATAYSAPLPEQTTSAQDEDKPEVNAGSGGSDAPPADVPAVVYETFVDEAPVGDIHEQTPVPDNTNAQQEPDDSSGTEPDAAKPEAAAETDDALEEAHKIPEETDEETEETKNKANEDGTSSAKNEEVLNGSEQRHMG
jgi:ribonuclease E